MYKDLLLLNGIYLGVLVCLQKAPYEPLHEASRLHVKLKTAFLLALLCLIRALKFYLKMTEPYRQNRTRLFLPIKCKQEISKSSISRWISYTIKLAYKKLTNRDFPFLKIKAHEVRALSSSRAFFDKVPLNEILKAAVWNQSSTFAKFNLRDMSQQLQNLHHLGPVVMAQKVEGGSSQQSLGCLRILTAFKHERTNIKVTNILYIYMLNEFSLGIISKLNLFLEFPKTKSRSGWIYVFFVLELGDPSHLIGEF